MKRLTKRDEYGNADIIGVESEDLQLNLSFDEFNKVTAALNRLADYEDLQEKGLLLKLPCKVGDTLYCDGKYFAPRFEGKIRSFKVDDILTQVRSYFHGEVDYSFNFDDFGKIVFLTQAEAEEALKRMERSN